MWISEFWVRILSTFAVLHLWSRPYTLRILQFCSYKKASRRVMVHLTWLHQTLWWWSSSLKWPQWWHCIGSHISRLLMGEWDRWQEIQLHWLPVRQRIVFKIATLVHQSLSGNAPAYLADDCQLVADAHVRQLRFADTWTLFVCRSCSSFGDRTFAGAHLVNWDRANGSHTLRVIHSVSWSVSIL